MPYIGRELDRGNYLKLDDISSSFNGSTTTFNLTNGGNAFYPGSAFSILVVLAGVVQEPEAAYQINQTQITFASAPLAGDQFFCIVLGQALGVNTPANGSVNGTQLAKPFNYDNYFYLNDTTNRVGVGTATPMTPLHVEGTGRFTDLTVTGDLTVEGTTTTLDTVVTEVDKLEVSANNSTVGVAITQSGTGDIFNLYDGSTEVFSVRDGGNVGIKNATGLSEFPVDVGGEIASKNSSKEFIGINLTNNEARIRSSYYSGASGAYRPITFYTSDAERLRIDANGNVLIKHDTQAYLNLTKNNGGGNGSLTYNGSIFAITSNSVSADMQLGTNSTPRLTIKGGGNIGIGTDTISDNLEVFAPTNASLQIKGGAAGSDANRSAQLKLLASGSKLYVMEADATDGSFRILDSSTERLRITSAGLVGIGENTPGTILHIKKNDATGPTITLENGSNETYINNWGSSGPSGRTNRFEINAVLTSSLALAGQYISLQTGGAGDSNEKVRITSGGLVGIGTDNPGSLLTLDHATNPAIQFKDSGTKVASINSEGTQTNIASFESKDLVFATSTSSAFTERLRITSDGKVGIGTNSITHRFHVYGANTIAKFQSSTSYVDLMFQNTGSTNGFIQYSNAGNFRFYANSGSTPTLTIKGGSPGDVGIGEADPDCRLHIKDTINTAYTATNAVNSANNLIKVENASTTANAFAGMQFRVGSGADLYFGAIQQNTNAGDFYFANQDNPDVELMRIKSTGLVGIGTDNPATNLDVNGSLQLRASGNYTTYATRIYSRLDSTHCTVIESYLNNTTAFEMMGSYADNGGANPRIVLGAGGRKVGINVTNPQAQLHVDGTIHQTSIEYPTIRPVLDLNFATNKFLDDRITFRRDSIATYYGADGLLKYASINEPRFPYDPDTGESLGLLIEDPGTNLISGAGGYGSDIRNGTNLGNAPTSTVVDGITLPDGTVGKVRRIQIHPSGNSGMRWGSTGGGNINTPYSASVWARAVSGTASFSIDANDNGTASYTLTEEWVRMQCTGTTGEGAYQFMDLMGNAGHDAYFWGFQLENNGLVTSYIPVESHMSNNTRANDVAYITGENFTDFYNQSEGTLVLSADIAYLPTSNQAAVVFEDESSASTDLIALGYRVGGGSSGNLGSWYQGNGSQVAYFNHNAGITANTEFRQAFAYKKDNLASSVNGGTPQTDNSGTLSTSIDRVKFGGYYADTMKSGHIRYFKYFNKRLSNAQLQGLTTQ